MTIQKHNITVLTNTINYSCSKSQTKPLCVSFSHLNARDQFAYKIKDTQLILINANVTKGSITFIALQISGVTSKKIWCT